MVAAAAEPALPLGPLSPGPNLPPPYTFVPPLLHSVSFANLLGLVLCAA